MTQPILPVKHVIAELRFAPTLRVYSAMDAIGIELAEAFSEWQRSPLTLDLRDQKHRRRFFMSHRRSFFERINVQTAATELDQAKSLFDMLHHRLQFTQIARVGIRQLVAFDAKKSFKELTNITSKKLFATDAMSGPFQKGELQDVGYVVVVKVATGWSYNLQIGPMSRDEWFERIPHEKGVFPSEKEFQDYRDSFPKDFLYIDVDCFRLEFPYSELPQMLLSVRETSADVISEVIKYVEK